MEEVNGPVQRYSELAAVDYRGHRVRAWAQRHDMAPTFYGVVVVESSGGAPLMLDMGGKYHVPEFSASEDAAQWALEEGMAWIDARMSH